VQFLGDFPIGRRELLILCQSWGLLLSQQLPDSGEVKMVSPSLPSISRREKWAQLVGASRSLAQHWGEYSLAVKY